MASSAKTGIKFKLIKRVAKKTITNITQIIGLFYINCYTISMKQALILQGWPQKTTQHWYPWLKKELENKGFEVFLPDLPTMYTKNPNMPKQIKFLEKLVKFNKETVLVGHSLGTQLAMRLAEKHQYKTMILVGGWDFNDLTKGIESFWPNKINHAKIIKNTQNRFVVHSDNDPYITKLIASDMASRLMAKFVLISKGGHFMENEGYKQFPKLLKLV